MPAACFSRRPQRLCREEGTPVGRRRQRSLGMANAINGARPQAKPASAAERQSFPPLRRNDSRPLSGAANRAAASKAARLLRHRRRVAAFPPAGTAEKIRPARLKRGLGGSCNVHRRSEEPAPPEEQDYRYTSGQKEFLEPWVLSGFFAPFWPAKKGPAPGRGTAPRQGLPAANHPSILAPNVSANPLAKSLAASRASSREFPAAPTSTRRLPVVQCWL